MFMTTQMRARGWARGSDFPGGVFTPGGGDTLQRRRRWRGFSPPFGVRGGDPSILRFTIYDRWLV